MKNFILLDSWRSRQLSFITHIFMVLLVTLPVAIANATVLQEKHIVKGIITDAKTDEPVIGVTILVKGETSTGTISNVNGQYSIEVQSINTVLLYSYIGYQTQEIIVGSRTNVDVKMEENTREIDEVVVIGYGTQKKVNLTGSVSSVSTKDLIGRAQNNVLASIQGAVPGVTIITRPGGASSINFRGRGNLGSSDPLFVIDGAISSQSFFNSLEPTSIESISFLKDAASSAIYGSRAAYGVVLVTTKQGQNETNMISYNGSFSISNPTYLPKVVSSGEYAEMLNEGKWNSNPSNGKNQAYSAEEIGWFKDGSKPDLYPNSNWIDEILEQWVPTTRHSVNFSGGTKKLRYFTGLGYLYNKNYGFISGRKNSRYNVDVSLTSELKKWLTLRGGVKFIKETNSSNGGFPGITRLASLRPTMVGIHSDGTFGAIDGGRQAPGNTYIYNPYRILDRKDWSNNDADNMMLDFGIDLALVKGFAIHVTTVYTSSKYESKSYSALQNEMTNFITKDKIPGSGKYINSMNNNWSSSSRLTNTITANYEWSNKIHTITTLAGGAYENYSSKGLGGSRKNFPIDGLEDMNAGSDAPADLGNYGHSSCNKMMSYFGRVGYSYDNRYLFEANIRTDASSRFHPDNRWGIFPSFSAGWRINQETFLKNVFWISNLKLRASWGQLGNINNVGNYDYFQNYTSGSNFVFDGIPVKGISESRPANANLGWEAVTITDIGLDIDFWSGKLSITADYYNKRTKDILMRYQVPTEVGIPTAKYPSQNIGKVENKGLELMISHRNKIGHFSYSISGNMSLNKNKIIDLGESDDIIFNGGDKIRQINKVGEAIGSFYGLSSGYRLYTQEEIDAGHYYTHGRKPNAGDVRYNVMRDNVEYGSSIDESKDRVILGNNMPDFTYGINASASYKGVDLSIFGQGVSGATVALEVDQVTPFNDGNTPKGIVRNRWTIENPNPNALWPRIYGGSGSDKYNQFFSDWNLFSGDYFRIKSIALGYTLPATVMNKLKMDAIKIYVTGENLLTVRGDKRMKDFDPEEISGRGIGAFVNKSVSIGFNISF